MKNTIFGYATKAMMVAAALLGTVLVAGTAKAQADFRGTFTLEQQARWGEAILPAGQYTLSIAYGMGTTVATIRNAKSGRIVAFVASPAKEQSGEGESALLLTRHEKGMVVQALRVAELNTTFLYGPVNEARFPEEASNTRKVAILLAQR